MTFFVQLRYLLILPLILVFITPLSAGAAVAASEQEMVTTKARFTVESMREFPEELPVEDYLSRAKGVLIVPELVKGGFIVGAEGGHGVLLLRGNDGTWSNPAFYFLAAGSIGLQIGGQVSEVIFTLMTDNAVRAMIDDEFKFGGDISVAVAHKGAGLEASSSTDLDADIYAFSKAVGLFGGAALEGAKIFVREEWNESYYGAGATPQAIVVERRFSNPQATKLRDALR